MMPFHSSKYWILFITLVGFSPAITFAEERPNFIVIMADDLGYGDLSCYDGWIDVPSIERMAEKGVRLTDFHSSGNVCSPTRAGLLTGRYQQRAGIPGVIVADTSREVHDHGLQPIENTFAEVLRDGGYATGMFGKWHLGYTSNYNPVHNGFDQFKGYVSGNIDYFSHIDQAGNYDWWHQDEFAEEEGYSTHLITEHSVNFIRSHADKPFCLYVAHEAPHYPFQGPNDSAERSIDGSFKNQGARQDLRSAYREMVEEMDKGVGEILDVLDELEIAERTFVMFFSDNGASRNGSNEPLRGNKGSNWEGGHRVPCVAVWPGVISPGTKCDQLSISIDVMPTLLAAAGVDAPQERKLDGINLLPYLTGEAQERERTLFWNGQAVRKGTWKLMTPGKGNDRVQLFDLSNDIGEKNNVAEEYPDLVREMRAALNEWKSDVASNETPQPTRDANQKQD